MQLSQIRFSRLDHQIYIADVDLLAAQPQCRAADQHERNLFGCQNCCGENNRWEFGPGHAWLAHGKFTEPHRRTLLRTERRLLRAAVAARNFRWNALGRRDYVRPLAQGGAFCS
jgi:hypothetical protein